jgi:uncharacterized protein
MGGTVAVRVVDELRVRLEGRNEEVSGLFLRPEGARWLLVLGHGAGTDMRHRSMEATAAALAGLGIATMRFNFLYREQKDWRPDTPAVAGAVVRGAVHAAAGAAPDLPLFAAGPSGGA